MLYWVSQRQPRYSQMPSSLAFQQGPVPLRLLFPRMPVLEPEFQHHRRNHGSVATAVRRRRYNGDVER